MALISNPSNLDKALDLVNQIQREEPSQDVRHLLDQYGGGLRECVSDLVDIAKTAKSDNAKLDAVKTMLKMHGISLKDEETSGMTINFLVQGDNMQMQNILIPKR